MCGSWNSSRSLISASLLSVLHYTNDRYNPPRRIDLAQFKMNNSRGPSQAAAFYFSRSSPTSRGKSTLCAECLGINEQNTRFVPGTGKNTDRMAYPHYHTIFALRESARNGCPLCQLFFNDQTGWDFRLPRYRYVSNRYEDTAVPKWRGPWHALRPPECRYAVHRIEHGHVWSPSPRNVPSRHDFKSACACRTR